ncbi:DUF302 domain-containing protein [Campylobacter showae]|uniref:DUF302 domain-containing protein n=1 Tax=Campylobacter showae TaxID=204 RepID=UPI0026EDB92F|nr:DUF302 domain-containing protein [Campylobacter showae]
MKRLFLMIFMGLNLVFAGVTTGQSELELEAAVKRFQRLLDMRDISEFAVVPHHVFAAQTGVNLMPSITVIFGAPGVLAPLIECEPSLALELPFKFLFQKRDGKTVVSFEDIKSIAARYGVFDCHALDAAQRLERELFDAAVK